MPIYEYRCRACGKRSTHLILNIANPPPLACTHCRSGDLERLLSRFAAPKSEEARLESLADPDTLGDFDESDPKSMARFMKRMGEELGEDTDDLEEALEAADEEEAEEAEESDATDIE